MLGDRLKPSPHTVSWSTREKDSSREGFSLKAGDLFDRVINLKFVTSDIGKDGSESYENSYVLRSDFELVDSAFIRNVADGNITFGGRKKVSAIRKCRLKPSIKVQYKQVAGNTAIEVDIFVQNFFMLDSEGKTLLSFSNVKGHLSSVEIQMGYFGQFEDFFRMNLNGVPTLDEYFNFNIKPDGVQTLTCNVTYCQTDKLPPDSTLHIHGFVGSCYTQPVSTSTVTEPSVSSLFVYGSEGNEVKFTNFAHYLYNNITRRFLRTRLPATSETEASSFSLSFSPEGKLLSDTSALKYGVKVFISQGVVGDGKSDIFLGKQVMYDSEGNPLEGKMSSCFTQGLSGETPMKALNAFMSTHNPSLRAQPLENGDYLLYLNEEVKTAENFSSSPWYTFDPSLGKEGVDLDGDSAVSESEMGLIRMTYDDILRYVKDSLGGSARNADVLKYFPQSIKPKVNQDRLPAVYNIAYDNALCTIVCPFFFFLTPFQKFYFASRYAVSSMVAYYLDQENNEMEFTGIWQSVSFATVENVNEVQICCVPSEA